MNIRLSEDYQLTSDKYQYILQERKIAEKGKQKGKERWDNVGYYSKLNQALESYIDMRVKDSDNNSVAGLLSYLKEITKEVKALAEVE
jgi:hypothetical protein